jgi:hypothetical protein
MENSCQNVYLFARYFGTGVIVATAFVHLLDPAYKRIGPKTCVVESDIVLTTVFIIFLLDLAAEVYANTSTTCTRMKKLPMRSSATILLLLL